MRPAQQGFVLEKPLALATLNAALLLGCNRDPVPQFQPPPAARFYSTQILPSERLDSVPADSTTLAGKPTQVRCATCHDRVDTGSVAEKPEDLKEFHQGLTFRHGALACSSCHEDKSPITLHLATGASVPTTQAMQLCSQCHGSQRKAYDHGAHGGMNGHWDLSRGPRTRNQCVECHDPHVPALAPVRPAPQARLRGGARHAEGER